MKSSRLIGLFFLSLFLAACWLSSIPGAEDPWDENKVVVGDSGTSLDNPGGHDTDGEDVGGGFIIVLHGGINFCRIFDIDIVILPGIGTERVKKGGTPQHSSVVKAKEPKAATGNGKPVKTRK